MRQTTLFDFCVEKKKSKEIIDEIDESIYPELQKVIYKSSRLDSDSINGFDTSLKNWIYPTNYPVRDYQLQIVHQCLYKNTLVCLPTGLGKTFIATVVMYNFYRWYPTKKIIFVAPTRPLVRQQMLSATQCVPIDSNDVVEMTGSIAQNLRISIWKNKRIFFLTAQVFVNDLTSCVCPVNDVVMVVLDEAHKATGNHAYCQAVRLLSAGSRLFRVLGLSATPGNDIKTIQDVIQNLLISHIELRTDECKDIQMYSHERLIDEIIVPLGNEVIAYRDRLYAICEPIINRMKSIGAIKTNMTVTSGSKYGFLTQKDAYKASTKNSSYKVLSDFALLISMYHAIELVQQHGLKPLFLFLSNALTTNSTMPHIVEMMKNHDFMNLLQELEAKFTSDVFVGGHPKLEKLKEIVKFHFEKYKDTNEGEGSRQTRVMVFSQFRDSVNEILRLLDQLRPLVRPVAFVGRANNGSQKEQLEAMRQFISGDVNVLVSTCIGEEGIDVGEVDLIVCFDAQGSPIRLVQRLGRTGRKREGRIVMLLSEGKEVSSYRSSIKKKSRIHSAIFEGYKHLIFYPDNPRLVPIGFEPTVLFQKCKLQKKVVPPRISIEKPALVNDGNYSQIPKISFTHDSFEHMRCFGEETNENVTFSERYRVKRHRRSLYQAQKTFRIGHSVVTEGVVSILKLKEMHCRGKTNMIFHLGNSRNVDIEEPMTQEDELSQHSLDSFSISISDDNCELEGDVDGEEMNQIKRYLLKREIEDIFVDLNDNEFVFDSEEEEEEEEEDKEDDEKMSVLSGSFASSMTNVVLETPEKPVNDELIESEPHTSSDKKKCYDAGEQEMSLQENDICDINTELIKEIGSVKFAVEATTSTPINNAKKMALLNSFKLSEERYSDFNAGVNSVSKTRTSTPIRKDRRSSLLNSFHNLRKENTEVGFDTALDMLGDSCGGRCELSTDLFEDVDSGNCLIGEQDSENGRKCVNLSAVLSSFNVSAKFNMKTTKSKVIACNSEEDLFSIEEQLFSDSEDHQFSPLSVCYDTIDNIESSKCGNFNNSECKGLTQSSAVGSPRFELDCFLDNEEDKKSRGNVTFGSDGFLDDKEKIKSCESPSFELDSFSDNAEEKKSRGNETFGSGGLLDNAEEKKSRGNVTFGSDGLLDDKEEIKSCGSPSFELDSFSDIAEEKKSRGNVTFGSDDLLDNAEEKKSHGDASFGSDYFLDNNEDKKSCCSPSFELDSFSDNAEEKKSCGSASFGSDCFLDNNGSPSFLDVIDENRVFEGDKEGNKVGNILPAAAKENATKITLKKKPSARDFFLTQADTSGRGNEDDDLEGSFLDRMEESFIDDTASNEGINTQMEEIYVRSLHSPTVPGAHRFTRNYADSIVDTQLPVDEDYVCDSFVVDDDYRSPKRKKTKPRIDNNKPPTKRFKRLEAFDDSFFG